MVPAALMHNSDWTFLTAGRIGSPLKNNNIKLKYLITTHFELLNISLSRTVNSRFAKTHIYEKQYIFVIAILLGHFRHKGHEHILLPLNPLRTM